MDIRIRPAKLSGTVCAPASKSIAHRALICAALSDSPARILCGPVGRDVLATAHCLTALGANITENDTGFYVEPVSNIPQKTTLYCGESGSTLRFLMPLVGVLGVEATFLLEGRLPFRPLYPLWEEMQRMGCILSRPAEHKILCRGRLRPGNFSMDGRASSQFLSGLMMALQRLPDSSLRVNGPVQSRPYVELTKSVMTQFPTEHFSVEGDWSNAAFFLAANTLGSAVAVTGLDSESLQGDKAIVSILLQLEKPCTITVADIPDLLPILAVVAACKKGAVFTDTARLRLKESDRIASVCNMLTALGGRCCAEENTLTVFPADLKGGTVDSCGDHRIAMAAAVAATVCREAVTILQADSTEKSYPQFWQDYEKLGGALCTVSTANC